jgi:drug/metabolite transporter (DMT)-like permease
MYQLPLKSTRLWAVLGLTATWWFCAIEVTIAIKYSLRKAHADEFRFPYPLALTVFTNIGTTIITQCLALMLSVVRSRTQRSSAYGAIEAHNATSLELAEEGEDLARIENGGALEQHIVAKGGSESAHDIALLKADWIRGLSEVSTDVSLNSPRRSETRSVGSQHDSNPSKQLESTDHHYNHVALILIGLVQGLSIAAKNEALQLLSVATRTMIFAMSVLVVMLMARLFGLERLGKDKVLAGLMIAAGGLLQHMVWFHHGSGSGRADEPFGYALAFAALVLDALRWVILQSFYGPAHKSEACTSNSGPAAESNNSNAFTSPFSKLQQVSLVMLASTPICVGLMLAFEPKALSSAVQQAVPLTGLVMCLSLGVAGITVAEFWIVQWTSAVTFNVIAQLHSIPLILAGIALCDEQVAPSELAGLLVCTLGAIVYSWAKQREEINANASVQDRLFLQTEKDGTRIQEVC